MQGKAPNANRTSTERLLAHPQVAMLLQCIRQTPQGDDKFRYDRVILLADPDADGLHAGLLLVLLLIRQVPELINQGKLYLLRAPLYGFYLQDECTALAYSDRQAKTVATELEAASVSTPLRRRFKGIASLSEDLRRAILQPECLARHQLTMSGCEVLCRPLL